MEYRVVDKLTKGDYIFIHYNGYVFNANNYPYNLRDGIANRELKTGECVTFIPGEDTKDFKCKTVLANDGLYARKLKQNNISKYQDIYGQREQNQEAI